MAWRSPYALIVVVLVIAAGCSASPRPPKTAHDGAIAAGQAGAIVFKVHSDPVDVLAPVPAGAELDPASALRQALTMHPQIQAALARVQGAHAEAQQARLLPNPILSVALRFPEAGSTPIVEASLTAELLSLLQRPGRVSAADYRLRAASAEAVTQVLDVVAEVQERYAQVQALEAGVPLIEERQRLLGRLLEIAESRLRAGEGIRLDVTTLRAQQLELEIEAADQAREAREARLQLARLMGQPSDPALWPLAPWSPPVVAVRDEQQWLAKALQWRPEVQANIWELSALGVEERLSRLALLEGSEVGVEGEREEQWSAGPSISVPLPLFDWGQARRAAARAKRIEASHQLTHTRRLVIEEVRRGHGSLLSAQSALARVESALIPLLERRLQESESAYRAGQSDIVPVVLAAQDLQAGRAKHLELQQKALGALIRLQRAAGGPGHSPSIEPASQPAGSEPAQPETRP